MSVSEEVINEMIVSRVRDLLDAGNVVRAPVPGAHEVDEIEHLEALARNYEARARTARIEVIIRDLLNDLDADKRPRVSPRRRTPK